MGVSESFENSKVKLLAKETKWTSLEFRTHPTFLETLISKYDYRPVKLPGLLRNGPQTRDIVLCSWVRHFTLSASLHQGV